MPPRVRGGKHLRYQLLFDLQQVLESILALEFQLPHQGIELVLRGHKDQSEGTRLRPEIKDYLFAARNRVIRVQQTSGFQPKQRSRDIQDQPVSPSPVLARFESRLPVGIDSEIRGDVPA